MTSLAGFLEGFVLPLVAGGEVHVGEPVRPRDLLRWEGELGGVSPLLEKIDEARYAAVATLVVRPPAMLFQSTELRLSVALHDALVLQHPKSDGWLNRRGRRELAGFARSLAEVPLPETTAELLGRHALVGRLFELTRRDTMVRWWTGKAEFRGEEPPPRLLRWRKVRRVKEESASVAVAEVLAGDDGRGTVAALLTISPLTDLLSLVATHRRYPTFRWGGQVAVLRDAELARAVAYHWLEEIDAPKDRAEHAKSLRAPAAAAVAWEQTLATPLELLPRARARPEGPVSPGDAARLAQLLLPPRPSPPLPASDIRAATAFLVHLNALCALAEIDQPDLDAPSPLIAAGLSAKRGAIGAADASGMRLFFCVPDVAARCDPALAKPVGLAAEPRLARRFAAHRAQVRAAVGEERLAQLARRLLVCL